MTARSILRLCFVGDSLTLGVGDPEGRGWVGRLLRDAAEKGAELTGYNLGVRRDTSLDIAGRWKQEVLARLPQSHPGGVVFAFGTNDCLEEDGNRRVSCAATLAASRNILAEAARLAPVLMIGPPPTADSTENMRISALSTDLEALCSMLNIPFFSSFSALALESAWRDELRAGDGYHPSAQGYAILAHRLSSWAPWQGLVLSRTWAGAEDCDNHHPAGRQVSQLDPVNGGISS